MEKSRSRRWVQMISRCSVTVAFTRVPNLWSNSTFLNAGGSLVAMSLFGMHNQARRLQPVRAYSSSPMDQHNRSVERIADSVRRFYKHGEPFRVQHGSTNSTRPRRHNHVVDISDLSNVLKVDVEKRIALVEPNVPMDRLVEATLPFGMVPPVVMEFPGITAGGGYAGTAGESSSFKYGFFDRTTNSVEMVLANGDVTTASETQNSDLFRGAAGAVGTLGITTLLELQLIPAKMYVKATYHPKRCVADTIRLVKEETNNPTNDYVDGILFSKDHGVVVTGTMTDEKPSETQVQTFSRSRDPWYYLHVKDKTQDVTSPVTEYIPLAEYLFRYDRGGFWVGASSFDYFKFPFNKFTRWFLDDFLNTRMKWLYAHSYYTEDEFWQQFDKEWYDDLRKKYHAQSLPNVYDKVAVDVEAGRKEIRESWSHWVKSKRPLGGLWGIYKAIKSREYMIARTSAWKKWDIH
ncbi:FAD binding domain-containing protein [Histoplasma capsulatum]|uniref:Delta(24)-sterol reductase n=1 Tax=Ajellomyces capsulatus TaxID=5037 RepID=A0A8A1MDF6_AJECA|nr:FAD binding domain-containing protein [Histoplasma capsulatum]